MSDQNRALVVDDSKSARLVLRRMLEKHDLIVDTFESATQALEFLTHNRPDVIFMDHMMPGMDGFEAVKAIKDNPNTATIPVMMYTSKGGDLYLGQARALGAVGVLPKTVAPAELYDSLKKIGLIDDRRSETQAPEEEHASERAEDLEKQIVSSAPLQPFTEPGMRRPLNALDADQLDNQLRYLLEEQRVELRKDLLLSMETVSRQTGNKLYKELDEKFATFKQEQSTVNPPSALPTIILGVLLFVSLVWIFSMHNWEKKVNIAETVGNGAQASSPQQAIQAINKLEALQSETVGLLRKSWELAGWAVNQELQYPYDEIALDKGRVEIVEQLLTRLSETGYQGKITLETHVGEFCLLGDEESGFRLPPPDLTVDKCEFIGNPVQAADSPAAHQSLGFANFLGSTPLLEDSPFSLEVVAVSREAPLFDYPAKSEDSVAQAWNQVAAINNRVVIKLATE